MLFTPPRLPIPWIFISAVLLISTLMPVTGLLGSLLPLPLDPNNLIKMLNLNYLGNITDQLQNLYSYLYNIGTTTIHPSYDYIIIGAGPAGCVLANRLSENPALTVLLIEAGQPETVLQNVPLLAPINVYTNYMKIFDMKVQPGACLSIENQQCPYPVGRSIGGGSVVNYLIYTRGNRHDFERWEAAGNPGWGYDDVVPVYESLERNLVSAGGVNVNGKVSVEYSNYQTELLEKYLSAGADLNLPLLSDYNGPSQLGIGRAQGTSQNGKRMTAGRAYIYPIYAQRPNLHILTNAVASKIVIDGDKIARSVQFTWNNFPFDIPATREILLSAGPIKSPQILMLSGVGPASHLAEIGIPLVKDLPVGQQMYDHVALQAPTFRVNTTRQSLHLQNVGVTDVAQYGFGQGLLTLLVGLEAISFLKTPNSPLPSYCPDLEMVFLSGSLASDLGIGFRKLARIRQDVYDRVFKPLENPAIDAWTAILLNMHTKSKGKILLMDANINSDPVIDYPFFDDPYDVEVLLSGIRKAIEFAETPTMKKIGATLHDIPLPDCEKVAPFNSDEYWRCYIRHLNTIIVHTVATNKMGNATDPEAVVDSDLRVYGIGNLRVVDTSVIPVTVSAHTQAFSYLIGEKAAQKIIAGV